MIALFMRGRFLVFVLGRVIVCFCGCGSFTMWRFLGILEIVRCK